MLLKVCVQPVLDRRGRHDIAGGAAGGLEKELLSSAVPPGGGGWTESGTGSSLRVAAAFATAVPSSLEEERAALRPPHGARRQTAAMRWTSRLGAMDAGSIPKLTPLSYRGPRGCPIVSLSRRRSKLTSMITSIRAAAAREDARREGETEEP